MVFDNTSELGVVVGNLQAGAALCGESTLEMGATACNCISSSCNVACTKTAQAVGAVVVATGVVIAEMLRRRPTRNAACTDGLRVVLVKLLSLGTSLRGLSRDQGRSQEDQQGQHYLRLGK